MSEKHPLFERLMARLDEVDDRIISLQNQLAEQHDDMRVTHEHLERLADNMASMEHDLEAANRCNGAMADEINGLRDEARRLEWHSWLPAQAQENIRRAS